MKIIVDKKLTYNCDFPVAVGDTVVVPAPWWANDCSTITGTVTGIGSSYDGYLVNVIKVLTNKKITVE